MMSRISRNRFLYCHISQLNQEFTVRVLFWSCSIGDEMAACSFWGWPSEKKSLGWAVLRTGAKFYSLMPCFWLIWGQLQGDLPHFCCVPCLLLETPPQLIIRSRHVSATFTFGVKSFCSVDRDFLLLTDIYKSFIWSSCHRGIDEMIVVCWKHVVWHISWELIDMCSSVCTNMHMLFYLWGIKTLIAGVVVVRLFLVPLASPQLSWTEVIRNCKVPYWRTVYCVELNWPGCTWVQ